MTAYRSTVGLGVAVASMALMSTELVLTRIFSVVVWYHFAFFAISVALFGAGAAALFVHLRQDRLPPERTAVLLAWGSVLLAATIVAVDFVLVGVTPDWFGAEASSPFTLLTAKLVALFGMTALPFFVGGFVLALAMTRHAQQIHRLYFWDLAGAAAACLLVIPLLGVLGGPRALLVSAALAAAGALLFLRPDPAAGAAARRAAVGALVSIGGVAVLSATFGLLEVRVAKGVNLGRVPPEYNRWNSFSMVTVLPGVDFRGWGMSPAYEGPVPPQKTLVIDMNAMTTLTRFDGERDSVRHALFDLSALVYSIRREAEDVCVIGAGGGKDVLAALAAGSKRVAAVEINPLIVNDVVRGRYRDFTGGLYDRSDVDVHVEDGRSFIRRTGRRFDVILLSMVDTSAATAAGAYALTENTLYTTNAFRDFLSRLKPGGILSVSTASLENLAVGARLASIARRALRESGGGRAADSVVVAQTAWLHGGATLHDVLVKPDGFTAEEVETLERHIAGLAFVPTYLPGRSVPAATEEQGWIQAILTTPDDAQLDRSLRALPVDVSPVGDDRPFFFYQNRIEDILPALVATGASHLFGNGLVILAKVALIALVMTILFLFLPLVARRSELRRGGGPTSWDIAYVACLGLGFMFLEIAAIQRFTLYLGDPTYTLAVVLCVLLMAGASGSRLFQRVSPERARGLLSWVFGALAAYAAVLAFWVPALLEATVFFAPPARGLVAAALLLPLGVLLGIPFPTGLRAVASRAQRRIPWLWSINSATSVLGSVLATLVSLHAGISLVFVVGAGLYVGALAAWRVVGAEPVPVAVPAREALLS